MESAQVEFRTERLLGLAAQRYDPDLAELVRERLTGPCDVAIGLGAYLVLGQRGVLLQVVERLLAAPAFPVHAGVDDEPACTPHLVAQAAKILVRRLVHVHLDAELLAVERPAFAESAEIGVPAKRRQIAELACERDLKVMARHGFMQRQRRQ